MNSPVMRIPNAPATMQPQTEANSLVYVIERAARDPSVNMDKLERLMTMHEQITARNAEKDFNAAMTAAQAKMRRIAADSVNPQTRSKYASYAALDRELRPIYTEQGFALSFNTEQSDIEAHLRIICNVSHANGHSRRYQVDMPADGKGAKGGDVMTKTHAVGAAMSYGSRYLLKMIFNVAIGEDDTDGNIPGGNISAEQVEAIQELIVEVGADIQKFCAYLKVESVSDIKAAQFKKAVSALEAKRAKQ